MPKKKSILNKFERKIIRVLYSTHLPLTQYEVAKEADISWGSARKYLRTLERKKLVKKEEIGNIMHYEFDYKYYKKLKRKYKI